jgi:hypothetical protein
MEDEWNPTPDEIRIEPAVALRRPETPRAAAPRRSFPARLRPGCSVSGAGYTSVLFSCTLSGGLACVVASAGPPYDWHPSWGCC